MGEEEIRQTAYEKLGMELTKRAGVPEKSSATVTFAFLSAIAERKANGVFTSAEDFVARNPDLLSRDFLEKLYSPARLANPLARYMPLLPDLG